MRAITQFVRIATSAAMTWSLVTGSVICLALGLEGCTPGAKNRIMPSLPPPAVGDALFSFDYQTVTELLLAKDDPQTGDHWAARVWKPTPRSDASEWKIQGAGGSAVARDSRADGYFVLHLLDTLRTLRVEQSEAPGPLSSMGLDPPRFALQWRVDDRLLELKIGASVASASKEGGVYAWIPGHDAFVISGASLQMLSYITSFSSLRLKTWAGLVSDDVDEVETKAFYAQREGAEWTNRKHKRVHGDFGDWLERLTHQRVQQFIDDENEAQKLDAWLAKAPLQVRLKDRYGHSTDLALGNKDGKWYARSTARPGGVFEVYPESARALTPP